MYIHLKPEQKEEDNEKKLVSLHITEANICDTFLVLSYNPSP